MPPEADASGSASGIGGDRGQLNGGGSSPADGTSSRRRQPSSPGDRGIRIVAHPAATSSSEWSPSLAVYPKASPGRQTLPRGPTAGSPQDASGHDGVVGKLLGWLDPGSSPTDVPPGGSRHVARVPSGGAPDFTAVTEDPDKRRRRQQQQHQKQQPQRKAQAEERWRSECLAVGRGRRLNHVADMRLLWVSTTAAHRSGAAVLVVVGAHFRSALASIEDILLYTVLEFEKLAGRPYVVCYFNADAPMSPLPDTVWFQELHAALPPRHRELLRGIYLVHPRSHWAATRSWMYLLRQQDAIYGKVQLVNNLEAMLATEFDAGLRRDVPQLVLDYVARHPGAA